MKSIVRQNAEKDPHYRPYCLRCPGLVRMDTLQPFLWKCRCGAIHDERTPHDHHDQAKEALPRLR